MFRSGRLTRARLNQILGWVEKLPHNLKAVAKACSIYPSDLMAWYAAGQDPQCKDPLMVELAWRVAEIRANKEVENYQRLETLAGEGDFRAIEKIDQKAAESAWEIAPDNAQADELHKMLGALTPTPLLTDGSDQPILGEPAPEGDGEPDPDPAGDGEAAPIHPGPLGADQLPGGPPAR